MTVTLDPSELRNQASIKARPLAGPLRVALAAGLGGAGLIAFTYGAFSFFGGLADPRLRPARPAVVAASLPDFKDGLPALTSDGAAPKPTVLNLPKPPASQPEKAEIGLRTDPLPPAEPIAPVRTASADASAIVAPSPVAPAAKAGKSTAGKPTPAIENAQTVSGDPNPVALVAPARLTGPLAPAKAETVRARAVEPRAVAALAPEPVKPEADRPEPAKPEVAKPEVAKPEPTIAPAAPKRAAAPPKPAKVRTAKAQPAPETADAAPAPAPAPVAAPKADEDSDGIGSTLKSGIKAIGGIFGAE